jgi:RHS repeat-associated protein
LWIDWDGYQKWTYYPEDHVITCKTSNGAFNHYFTFTDQVGSILKAVDTNGTEKFSATYDPWGYQIVTKNQIGLIRGYTGHEMLTEYGLINMNGRLYDPLLGRFLSTDNFVQEPGSTQSFNHYSYCLNNPLKYNDPSGELPIIAIVGAVVISGVTNVSINSSEIHDVWHGLASFGIGAASGALSIVGFPALGSIVAGAGNSMVNQSFNNGSIDWGKVVVSTGLSLMTYHVGEKMGQLFEKPISNLTAGIENKILQTFTKRSIHGALGGFIIGTGFGLNYRDNIGEAFLEGAKYAAQGAIINGLYGLNEGYTISKQNRQVWCQDNLESIIDVLNIRQTMRRIDQGQVESCFRNDGTTFNNREDFLPSNSGPFKEWVVNRYLPNNRPGPERIVTGSNGDMWYSPDHYETFIKIR